MAIHKNEFPYLTDLMEKHLFQESASSMTEAIEEYFSNGEKYVAAALQELHALLNGQFSNTELDNYVYQHSDYIIEDSGIKTLEFIQKVLRHEPHENI